MKQSTKNPNSGDAIPPYLHGYTDRERERLRDQSFILEDLLHAGIHYGKGEKVLEIGCGVGAQTRILALNSPQAEITSIDINPESLSIAEALMNKNHITNVRFERQDIQNLAYDDERFDHIFVCFVLEHLPDPLSALRQCKRVLKTGGTITVIEGDHGSCFWHPQTKSSRRVWQALIEAQDLLGQDGLIGRKLYPLLTKAGYSVREISPKWIYADSSQPILLNDVVNKIIVPMIISSKNQIDETGVLPAEIWKDGISRLAEVGTSKNGTFFYTWFKAQGLKY